MTRSTVTVWKATWLPWSETFVRHQLEAMTRWDPVAVGLLKLETSLARDTDHVAFGGGVAGKVGRRAFGELRRSRRVRRLITAPRPQLVHSHFLVDAALIHPTTRAAGLPHVLTVHGNDITVDGVSARELQRRRSVLEDAACVIAVSDYIADRVDDVSRGRANTIVQPIGIPVERHPAEDAGEPDWDVIFVGRVLEQKGVLDAIEAVRQAQVSIGRPVRFAIVGDGALRETATARAAAVGVPATFLGARTPSEVADLLQRSRVFLGPSKTAANGWREGFGMVFLEAGLAGLPVVAYASGGITQSVVDGQTGLLATEGDVDGLADRLATLLAEPESAAELGRAGRKRVLAEYDIRTRTSELEAIYDRFRR